VAKARHFFGGAEWPNFFLFGYKIEPILPSEVSPVFCTKKIYQKYNNYEIDFGSLCGCGGQAQWPKNF